MLRLSLKTYFMDLSIKDVGFSKDAGIKKMAADRITWAEVPAYINHRLTLVIGGRIVGIALFATTREATSAMIKYGIKECSANSAFELCYFWVSKMLPPGSASYLLNQCMRFLGNNSKVKIVLARCATPNNSSGTIFKANSWLYFGLSPYGDFYLTSAGLIKNIAHARKNSTMGTPRTAEHIAKSVFGDGERITVNEHSYLYVYDKRIRKSLCSYSLKYPT